MNISKFFIFCLLFNFQFFLASLGLVVKNVVDGVRDNTKKGIMTFSSENASRDIPRLCQLLFNQVVKVIKEFDDCMFVEVDDFHFRRGESAQFFVDKNSLKLINETDELLQYVPYKNHLYQRCFLKIPYFDQDTNMHFSIGTEFVILGNYKDLACLAYFVPDLEQIRLMWLAKKYIFIPEEYNSTEEKRMALISILNEIIDQCEALNGKFPYVWGGMSILKMYQGTFLEETDTEGKKIYFWEKNPTQCFGVDCSGLIVLLARMFGIKNFPRNTSSLMNAQEAKQIKPGDLLCFKGHVVIIGDNDTIIQAGGYSSLKGSLFRCSMHEFLKNIYNIDDLQKFYNEKKPLSLINRDGKEYLQLIDYKILDLENLLSKF